MIMKRKLYTRREALAALTFISLASSCTPVKILFADKNTEDNDHDRTIRAFMETIVPGISVDSPNLSDIFDDPYYPFSPYKEIFAEDLDRSSFRDYKVQHFYNLGLNKRALLLERKFSKRGITKQIYFGALWLSQLSVYTGINNPDGACDIIDFECKDSKTASYSAPLSYLGKPATLNGNPS
jgi:hypothetical protein